MISERISSSSHDSCEVCLALFEAYSSLSCCFMEPTQAQPLMLAGLRCVHGHFSQMGSEYSHHIQVLNSMLKQFEYTRMESNTDSGVICDLNKTNAGSYPDMKTRMRKSFKEVKEKATTSNFSKFFG